MVKKSTRPGIAFFSLALAGIIVIQYCWIKSLQEDKFRDFRSRTISAIASTNEKNLPAAPWHKGSDTAIAAILRQSFSSMGLSDIPFEFSIGSDDNRLASRGFTQEITTDSANFILCYQLSGDGQHMHGSRLTVAIPAWKKFAQKDMSWIFGMCGVLSIMVIAVFCCALILDRRRRQLHYDNRADIISHLMQQLEIPLSTMSVAIEALQNDKVIYNSEKRQFYQEIINAENARLNERVNKIFEL